MLRQLSLFGLCCAALGCNVISPDHLKSPNASKEEVVATPTSVKRAQEPEPQDDQLLLAADCLAAENFKGAIKHLSQYVEKYPDQIIFRMQLAELLLKE